MSGTSKETGHMEHTAVIAIMGAKRHPFPSGPANLFAAVPNVNQVGDQIPIKN